MRHWQIIFPLAWPADAQLACFPVHIVESQTGDLAATQSQPSEQEQDGVVTAADRALAVAMRK